MNFDRKLLYNETVSILRELNQIPSSPFLPQAQIKFLTRFLKEHGYDYKINPYCLVVQKPSKNKDARKLIISSHLDHPGAVLKNNQEGVFFGSVGLERLEKQAQRSDLILKVFDPTGKHLGVGKVTKFFGNHGKFKFQASFEVPNNSYAQYDIPYFKEDKDEIGVYNADNAIDTAVMLSILKQGFESPYETYFVFNFHEEVHQLSAWHLASINYFNLTKRDFVLNLESPIIETNKPEKYPQLTYVDGPVLKLSNLGCLFGHLVKGDNLVEKMVRLISKKQNLKIQIGLAKGSDEARCFSNFPLAANIATLAIPNRYKHNWGENDAIVPEKILKNDIKVFGEILRHFLATDLELPELEKVKSLAGVVKESDDITNKKMMRNKMILNRRLLLSFSPTIHRGYYFPMNVIDKILDLLFAAISYPCYFYWKIFS